MKIATRVLLLLVFIFSLIGCKSDPELGGVTEELFPVTGELVKASGDIIQSENAPVTAQDISAADLQELVEGNNTFAFDLYKSLVEGGDDNLFISPYSISTALAMVYAGARGATEQQMKDTLKYNLAQKQLHAAFGFLEATLEKRGQTSTGGNKQPFILSVVNATWGQKDYQFLMAYLDVLAANYGAGIRVCDFSGDPEGSRSKINQWVSDETAGKILDLIPPGSLSPITRLILTNAIYFKAAWQEPFKEFDTTLQNFYLLDGSPIKTSMMSQTSNYKYWEKGDFQAIELPYAGEEMSMVVIVPDAGKFAKVEPTLTGKTIKDIFEGLDHAKVHLTLPKFESRFRMSLVKQLARLGMPDAFNNGRADFSGIDGKKELSISDVIHQTFMKVDEFGTEAAAATAVIMVGAGPGKPKIHEMNVNRPFIYLIRDIKTNSILFLGRVMNPIK